MPASRRLRPGLPFPEDAVRITFARSGGPGGQNVNKVETKAVARIAIADIPGLSDFDRERIRERLASRLTTAGEIVVHAESERTRERNVQAALDRLCEMLATALHRPRRRRATRPTRGSRERRLKAKKQRGDVKRNRRPPSGE